MEPSQPPSSKKSTGTAFGVRSTGVVSFANKVSGKFGAVISQMLTGGSYGQEVTRQVALRRITFDDPALLRGSFSTDVLRGWGALFDLGRDACDWHGLSQYSDHLDVFVSHNWSMGRLDKFLIISFYFNFRAAVCCTALVTVATAVLIANGTLPTVLLLHGLWWGPWCQVIGFVVFICVLLCWQEVGRLSRWRGPLLFLDRACIDQVDNARKQRGIEHLAAFLYHSWSMLICFSDEYLQKLWTVYEVASFLLLHPGSAMHVRHAVISKTVFGGMVITLCYNITKQCLHLPGLFGETNLSVNAMSYLLTALCMIPSCTACVFVVCRMARTQAKISERVKRFDFSTAKCFNEDDRRIVQRNIVVFMKHVGKASAETGDAEIIQDFEAMVHSEVPKLFAASLGRAGVRYHFAACSFLPYCLQSIDYACAQYYHGGSGRLIMFQLVYMNTISWAVVPLNIAMMFILTTYCTRKCAIKFRVVVLIGATFTVMFLMGSFLMLRTLAEAATEGSDTAVAMFVTAVALSFTATFFVFCRNPRTVKYRRRLEPI